MEDMRRNMMFQILDNNARERRNAFSIFLFCFSWKRKLTGKEYIT